MRKVFNIVFLANRRMFADLIDSIIDCVFDDWEVAVLIQCMSAEDREYYKQRGTFHRVDHRFELDQAVGPHIARMFLLDRVCGDINCNLDDDMILLPETKYSPIIEKLQDPSIGLISGNWGPFDKWIQKKKIEHKFIKQPIVYTGGGLLYTKRSAEFIKILGKIPYWDDNTTWSLHMYVNGYDNYRYMGSVAKHMVCRSGGLSGWRKMEGESVRIADGLLTPNGDRIGDSASLTQAAKNIHAEKRRINFGK